LQYDDETVIDMKKNKPLLCCVLSFALLSSLAQSAPLVLLPAQSGEPEMLLVKASLRELNYLPDAYVAMHYRQSRVVTDSEPNQTILMQIVSERLSGRVLAMSLFDGVVMSVTDEALPGLETRLDAMVKMLDGKLEKGDSIEFHYLAGRGSEVYVRGEFKGMLTGKDWFDAVANVALVDPLAATAAEPVSEEPGEPEDDPVVRL
jgi:hypothetical protein